MGSTRLRDEEARSVISSGQCRQPRRGFDLTRPAARFENQQTQGRGSLEVQRWPQLFQAAALSSLSGVTTAGVTRRPRAAISLAMSCDLVPSERALCFEHAGSDSARLHRTVLPLCDSAGRLLAIEIIDSLQFVVVRVPAANVALTPRRRTVKTVVEPSRNFAARIKMWPRVLLASPLAAATFLVASSWAKDKPSRWCFRASSRCAEGVGSWRPWSRRDRSIRPPSSGESRSAR